MLKVSNLHSKIVILKQVSWYTSNIIKHDLHSKIVILKPVTQTANASL